MDFLDIAKTRQSCRSYDSDRVVEEEKLNAILTAGRLAPSACNGQPYHFTVCRGQAAKEVAAATVGRGWNKFAAQAPILIVISEEPYLKVTAETSSLINNDYRSMDIGITCAYLTAEAETQGLSTCIIGWFDNAKIQAVCDLDQPVRLVITLGYATEDDKLRTKRRRPLEKLVSYKE